jgi:hypothetical protein
MLMNSKYIIKRARGFAEPFRVKHGSGFRLKDVDPGDTLDFGSEEKPRAKEALATGVQALAELQDKLYAQDRWAVLLIFQAMDAAGKDGTIKHVMSFTHFIAGPTVTRLMAGMGAEIIKVELAPHGDQARDIEYLRDKRSAYFIQQNRGKQSLCLDIRKPAALAIVKGLLQLLVSL